MPQLDSPAAVPAVRASDLAAGYGDRPVWQGANFSLEEGSFCALLGPNGAGKSTLISLLLGLQKPLRGSLEVLGAAPRRGNSSIGYVPQSTSFDSEFSIRGWDYARLGLDGHLWGPGLPANRQKRSQAVQQALQSVDAQALAERPIGRLSGGEQQRLVLAQALVGEPQLLLLDEPLSNLDVANQALAVKLIAEIARERKLTVILVAHDVNPLLPYINRVIYIAHGRVAVGDPAEIITSESLSRIYDAPVEVLRDRLGRIFVVGLESEVFHPHGD